MKRPLFIVFVLLLMVSACAPTQGSSPDASATPPVPAVSPTSATTAPVDLYVMTHDSFAVSNEVAELFQKDNNIRLHFVKGGDAGALVNKAILTKDAPQADVIYGVDNTFLSRALTGGIYEPYNAPGLQNIAQQFKLDPQNRALPVDYGDVCINYDKNYFSEHNLAVPQTFEDLIKPEYKGLLVVENAATSSPGLAFMMATIARFGPEKYLDYWKSLRDNGVEVVNGWETAYYTNFSASSGKGPQPLVVSYASSPAAEVIYASEKPLDSTTASLVGPGMCFRQIEFIGIVQGTRNRAAAEKFVDFVLGQVFQEDMPLQMYVYPVLNGARIPDEFQKYTQIPEQPATIDPAEIDRSRDQWITEWTKTVLQ
jgi:thiamine transport system substrate-binding protein